MMLPPGESQIRAGSWSLQASRLEGDCGPIVHIGLLTLLP